ncbi:hypothetical protein COF62_22875 [Bacillus toyonensis]|uniref:Uncharacterized protein n=1 Tax=Bacillus toyonensis TaxID=155322 RepID=A0AAP8F128_9BACI|nr:hypothetical protein CON81_26145 [Bacillus toyonensis]PEO74088.1 hypothetical protein CN570_28335 [Bacillus toyonensis]PHE09096.1 hypothetical protein COF62_22875 [Bacillus toyonensis]PHG27309.1 hypothetical protein COI60_31340 [Bacillus toyonensis]
MILLVQESTVTSSGTKFLFRDTMWMVASGIQWTFGYLRYGKESGKIKTASLIDMVDNMLNLLMKM